MPVMPSCCTSHCTSIGHIAMSPGMSLLLRIGMLADSESRLSSSRVGLLGSFDSF